MAAFGALGLCAPTDSRSRPTSPARCRSRRSRARARASSRRSMPCARCRASPIGGERAPPARRLGDQRGAPLVRQGAGRVLAALRAAGARRLARPARLRATRRSPIEVNAATDNPLVLVEDEHARLERQLPRAAARVRARRAGDGGRRAREHLRAPRRAAREPVPLRRPAGVPDARRRPQLGLHDPAVRGRVARQREQGARAIRRASTRSRRAPGRRITSRWGTPRGSRRGRCSRTPSGRSRSSCSPARRASSSSRRSSPVAAREPRARSSSGRSRRGSRDDRPLAADIEAVAAAIRDGSLVAAVEAEVGELP